MFCRNCGTGNPDGSTVCSKCGQNLSAAVKPGQGVTQPLAANVTTDGKAIASLVLGILSITVLWILAGIPAVILGHISRASIKKSMGQLQGAGMALAGLIMGYVSIATLPIILIVASIAIPALLRARQVAQESTAVINLKTLTSAEITYISAKGDYGTITELINANLLDSRFDAAQVSGYRFVLMGSGHDYTATAMPISANTGRFGYVSSADGVVRYQTETTETCIPCFPAGRAGAPVE
jgi:type II secretory pathway pseudopilin PulG